MYNMPHLRGGAAAGRYIFLPAIGRHEVLVLDRMDWSEAARIPVHGQPVFAVIRMRTKRVLVALKLIVTVFALAGLNV